MEWWNDGVMGFEYLDPLYQYSNTPTPQVFDMWQTLKKISRLSFERDPASRSVWEIALAYPGFHAMLLHRLAHWLWQRNLPTLARVA